MKHKALFTVFALALFVVPASAGTTNEFSFTASGGTITDDLVNVFSLEMHGLDPNIELLSLELEVAGLSHSTPADIDLYLVDPFGATLVVMLDRGDGVALSDATLTFNDGGSALPTDPNPLVDGATYASEGLGDPFVSSFGEFTMPGTDAWKLLVVDDGGSLGGGSFESWTLRGTVVPEPATLSLLALGGIAALRRRRSR